MHNKLTLSQNEIQRYSRTIMLKEIGDEGQLRICNASVAIVGAGALGSAVALSLAAAGVGTLAIADFDCVELSNLPRQLAYSTDCVGRSKLNTLAERLRAANPNVKLSLCDKCLSREDMAEFINNNDVCVEASDNVATKQAFTEIARKNNIPCVLGGIDSFYGQCITFNTDSRLNYNEIFGLTEESSSSIQCSKNVPKGIFTPIPSIIASIQSAEVLKLISGIGTPLVNRMLCVNALTMEFSTFDL